MEPKCVTGIYIHRIPCHHKGLTVRQLNSTTIRLADSAADGVVGHNEIRIGTLQVDTTGVAIEIAAVNRYLTVNACC